MVLDISTAEKIKGFVRLKPRTVQEIAQAISRNWRTANSYVEKIASESGDIAYRVLRKGTPGAVKIVYWNSLEQFHHSQAQERLFKQIETGKGKNDFSPFDVYQYVDEDKRSSFFEQQAEENINVKQDLVGTLRSAEKQILFFSGNMSWANLRQGNVKLIDVFAELAERGVKIKFLTKVDMFSVDNVHKISAINNIIGKDMLEIRHCEQPLRAFIVDNRLAKLKEIKNPDNDNTEGIKKKTYIFYELYDPEWVEWLQRVFWNLFRTSIPAPKRIKDLRTIKRL